MTHASTLQRALSIQGVSADREENDFYPTPPEGTQALIDRIKFTGTIWECACGDGAMSEVLKTIGCPIISSDLIDRGYGETGIDFLMTYKAVDNIVTNPPFKYATAFAKHALECASDKVALLVKIQFLESGKRYFLFRDSPLKEVMVFSDRLNIRKNGIKTDNGTMFCFAWFIWEHGYVGKPTISWIKEGETL